MQRRAKVKSTFARSLIDRRRREDESNLLSCCRNWLFFVQYFKCTPDADGIPGILIIFIPSLTARFVLISFNVRRTALGGTRIYLDSIKLLLSSREITGEITAGISQKREPFRAVTGAPLAKESRLEILRVTNPPMAFDAATARGSIINIPDISRC
jgi:hypothetical protein